MKGVYTTGEVAQICKVSQQTVIRCFDSGKLEGFRVPGSKFRRIPRESLVAFMKKNNIPLDNLDSGKKRILVVDDDEAIVEMFVELLERDGRFEVQTANGGFNAGIMVEKHRPDLMILDYKLPDVNGNVVCQTVRSKPEFDHMRIILISGVAEPSEVQMLLDAGADEFIRKPFQIDQVISRMAELLKL
ncbi:MAG: response regulator [Phycisphaerales bacterium]|nr:MAG: response regulator [Phycisphaerales bacterium]